MTKDNSFRVIRCTLGLTEKYNSNIQEAIENLIRTVNYSYCRTDEDNHNADKIESFLQDLGSSDDEFATLGSCILRLLLHCYYSIGTGAKDKDISVFNKQIEVLRSVLENFIEE